MQKKIFIFGIDGATLELIEPWACQGKLPNFRKIMKTGTYGTCQSTIHPLTPQAWATFLTGKNPGKHGLFDFGVRREGTYSLRLTTSFDRRTPAIWHLLAEAGLKSGIINVPLTYPPEPINGFMISGMHSPGFEESVYPSELYQELVEIFPDYTIDVMSHWYDTYDIFLEKVYAMTETRINLIEYVYKKYKPEYFSAVMVLVDRVQHALWGQMQHPLEQSLKTGWKYSNAVYDTYKKMDECIGRFLKIIDNDTTFIIMSDHGFGSLEKDVYLNRFLLDNGFMKLKDEAWNKPFDMANPFENIDWSNTRAYSYGLFGNIYINLAGREPNGVIRPGQEYENVLADLTRQLLTLRDPDDGKRIVDQVYRADEIYSGPYVREAPDILVVMRDYQYITRGGYELVGDSLVSKPRINHSGNHKMNGVAFFLGKNIKQGYRMGECHLADFCPTILTELGLSIPDDMDGRALTDIYQK